MAHYQVRRARKDRERAAAHTREALAHFADVAEGLRRAHEARIVPATSPANVMLGERGQVKIVDFVWQTSGAD